MPAPLLSERDLEFMLYELFDAESLTERERYSDHNRETFDAAIATSRAVAASCSPKSLHAVATSLYGDRRACGLLRINSQ